MPHPFYTLSPPLPPYHFPIRFIVLLSPPFAASGSVSGNPRGSSRPPPFRQKRLRDGKRQLSHPFASFLLLLTHCSPLTLFSLLNRNYRAQTKGETVAKGKGKGRAPGGRDGESEAQRKEGRGRMDGRTDRRMG
ncbi:hypothetical protein niasHT_030723 [Heterodera trifolii]|uniref:Uncharacterized protein n=1 Tax=Heterodera trifolii TaxID=157864 RepID=A0ABD2HSX0_9BILA